MATRILVTVQICCFLSWSNGCQTHNYAQRGAAVGGLTGGGVGAVIGEAAADKPLVGAVVGSAVGALTGAATGGALDEIDGRNQQRVDQAIYNRAASAVSLDDVISMSESGLSSDIIMRHIRTRGFGRQLSASELIQLRQRGVSDQVIASLQEAAYPPQVAGTSATLPAAPLVVEEHVYAPPFSCPPRWRYHYHHRRPRYPHGGLRWGLSFGN